MDKPDHLKFFASISSLTHKFFESSKMEDESQQVFEFKQISPNPHPELLALEFKRGMLKRVMEIYYALPTQLHGVLEPWTHWMPKRIMKEKRFLIDETEMSLGQYRLFLEALGDFTPYLEEVRFFVTREYSPASEKKPWIDEIAIGKGRLYFHRHHYQKTGKDEEEDRLDYYRNLHQKSPNDDDFRRFFQKELLIWTEILLNNDLMGDVKKYLDEARTLGSDEVNLWYLMGEYQQKTGEWQSALRYFKKALIIHPKHYWVSRKLGEYYFCRKQYRKSAEAYTDAIASFPRNPDHYFDRALCYKKLNQEKQAQEDFRTSIRNTMPQHARQLKPKAQALAQMGYAEDAMMFYKAIFKKSGQYVRKNNTREILEKGGYELVVLNEITQSGLEALLEIAKIEAQRGNQKKALWYCNKILKNRYDFSPALFFQGPLLLRLKKLKELAKAVEKLKVLESGNPQTYMLEGGLRIHQKEYQKAMQAYQIAAKININFYPAYHGVGHALAWMRRDQEALEYFQRALDIYSKDAACLADMASSLNNLGQEEEALEYLEEAIELRPDYYHPYFIKACILAKRGDAKGSVKLLRQMLKLDPSQKKWLKKEKDFDGIRHSTEFKKLLRDLKN